MDPTINFELPQRIAHECASLPVDKQATVLDFVLFLRHGGNVPRPGHRVQNVPHTELTSCQIDLRDSVADDPLVSPRLKAYLEDVRSRPAKVFDEEEDEKEA